MYVAPDIHIAQIGNRSVVLDIARDRYFGLNESLTAAVAHLTGKGDTSTDDQLARSGQKLLQRGILTTTPRDGVVERPAGVAASTWPRFSSTAQQTHDGGRQLHALLALAYTQFSLAYLPFRKTIGHLQHAKGRSGTMCPSLGEQDLLDAYARARPWFPVKPICRLDAFALSLYLWQHGVPATLVFGVRLEKFGAHCWVQLGDRTLNDSHDYAAQFTPIMAI